MKAMTYKINTRNTSLTFITSLPTFKRKFGVKTLVEPRIFKLNFVKQLNIVMNVTIQ